MTIDRELDRHYTNEVSEIHRIAAHEVAILTHNYQGLEDQVTSLVTQSGMEADRLLATINFAASIHDVPFSTAVKMFSTFFTYKDDLILPPLKRKEEE